MITSVQMYWLIMLDSIREATSNNIGLCILSVFSILGLIAAGIVKSVLPKDEGAAEAEKVFRYLKPTTVVLTALWFAFELVHALLPSTKQMAAIIVVPKVCNAVMADSALKKIPGKITSLASEWLDELKPAAVAGKVKEEVVKNK